MIDEVEIDPSTSHDEFRRYSHGYVSADCRGLKRIRETAREIEATENAKAFNRALKKMLPKRAASSRVR